MTPDTIMQTCLARMGSRLLGLLAVLLLGFTPAWSMTIDQGSAIGVTMSEDGSPTPFNLVLSTTKNNPFETFSGWSISAPPSSGSLGIASPGSQVTGIIYIPAPNFFGVVSFQLRSVGSAGTSFINVTVTVNPINDPPSFVLGPNLTVGEDSGPFTFNGWATGFNPGPLESQSLVGYSATADKTDLFAVQPAVSPAGVLTFTPATNRNGVATVSITVKDNGGTVNGGIDTSAVQTFTITITAVTDAIIFAKPTATGTGDGSSWANAFSLRQAMDYSSSGEEIWVAQGTHTPGTLRTDTFNLKAGVRVLGGFNGTETLSSQRNPRAFPTILSGDIGSVGVASDNCFRVVTASGSGTIDGFTIRDGNANGTFTEGAGMYIDGVSPAVSNCVFLSNSCTFTGGAVSIRNAGNPSFKAVVFSGNSAQFGGALYSVGSGTFENCIFQGNSATSEGGAIRTSSGGLTVFNNCTLTGNTCPASSAAISIYGTTTCTNTLVWANSPASLVSPGGGGTLTNCLVQGGLVTGFTSTGGLVTADPQFTNAAAPAGPDGIWGTADDGLFPQATSPARDAGTASGAPLVDIRGSSRPRGNGFDIGCFERGVIYVNSAATGANNGATWANAFTDLKAALTSATATDEVWVAAGAYSPSASDASQSFTVAAGVGLFGGFNGTETTRDARDWTVNRVTLNGAGLIRNILIANGTGGVIDGFIVTGANANGPVFPNSQAGGGLCLISSSPSVRNCVFVNNTATYAGAAIYCQGSSSPRVENCLFINNAAQFGGAIECESGTTAPTIVNCSFTGNTASVKGTALETASTSVSGVITNCIMWGNGPGNAIDANSSFVATVSNSIIQGSGGSSAWLGGSWGINGGGNLDADPQFFNPGSPAGADGLFFTADDGLVLLTGSPAANTGTGTNAPALDIRRQPRPTGAGFDMGCYEGQIGRVSFSVAASSVSESTPSTSIAVSLSAAADFPVTVAYAVTGGTATNGVSITPAGSASSGVLPLYAFTQDVRMTSLYAASEMGPAATYRSLSLDVNSPLSGTLDNVTIRMRTTNVTDFSVLDWSGLGGWDTVFQGPVSITSSGHFVFNFNQGDNAFIYDGTSNVMVDFIVHSNGSGFSTNVQASFNSAIPHTIYFITNDGSSFGNDPSAWFGPGDNVTIPTPINSYPLVPKLRFSTTSGGGLADYTLFSGTLTFAPGQTSKTIPVTILPDLINEPNETVIVNLSAPVGGVLGAITQHTLIIIDDDPLPVVQFAAATSANPESVTNPAVTVTLSAQSAKTVSVNYTRTGGTATPGGVDLTFTDGTLTFPPGVVSLTIPAGNFAVVSDSLDEDDETVAIALSAPVNATLGSTTAHICTIQDDDTSSITPSVTTVSVTESDLTAVPISITVGTQPYIPPNATAVVRVDVTASDSTEAEVSNNASTYGATASLWFSSTGLGTKDGRSPANAADWNAATKPQVFVRSVNDFIDDGDQVSQLSITANNTDTTDPRYKALATQTITVTTHDDADATGIAIAALQSPLPSGLPPLPMSENYFPNLDVLSTAGNGTIVTFPDVSRIQAGMRVFAFRSSERRFVAAVNTGTKQVTFDAPVTGFVAGDEFAFGFENVFLVTLTSQPIAPVKMAFSFANSRVNGFWQTTDTLNASNWNTGIQLVVFPQDNAVVEPDQLVGVTVTVASTTDPTYPSAAPATSNVLVYEDDVRGVTISSPTLTVAEGGTSQQYSVVLTSQPSGTDDVVVTPTPDAAGAAQITISTVNGSGAGAILRFNAGNWNTPQFVTVTAVDDIDFDPGAVCTLSNVISGPNNDYAIAAVTAPAVVVTTIDNESLAPIVSPSSGLVTSESGTQASFTVRLAAAPAPGEVVSIGPLTVSNTSSAEIEATVTTGASLFFARTALGSGDGYSSGSARAWDNPVTVTVTGGADHGADGDQGYSVVLPPMTSSLAGSPFIGVDPVDVTGCINTDIATAGVVVTGGAMNLLEGTSKTYTLSLTWNPSTPPTGNFVMVSITPASSDVTVDQSLVLFTGPFGTSPVTYNSTLSNVKTITVTATDDQVAEASKTTLIAHAIVASNSNVFPLALAVQSAQATVTDNDTPGVELLAPASLITTEAGGTATFSLRLKTQPTANVTVDLSLSGNAGEVMLSTATVVAPQPTKTLTFTPITWNVPQVVTVIGQDDFVHDGDRAFTVVTSNTASPGGTGDPFYNGITIPDINGVNIDNDTAGVSISKTTVAVTEGTTPPIGTDNYTITLNSQPTGTVTVALDGGGQVVFRVGSTPVTAVFFAATAGTGDGLGRDSANPRVWNNALTITVLAIDDQIKETSPQTAIITHTVSGADYAGVAANTILATITDNPTVVPGVTVTPAVSSIPEAGGTGTVGLVLTSKPTSTVVVAVASSDPTAATVTPTSITFTPSNWFTVQPFTVTGVNDDIDQHVSAPAVDNRRQATLSFTVASFDPNYDQRAIAPVTATIIDDDIAKVNVTFPTGGCVVNEAGTTSTFTVVLATRPVGTVTVPLQVNDPQRVLLSAPSVVFTPLNWNTPQTITVTGQDLDGTDDTPTVNTTISTLAPTSTVADAYSLLLDADVADVPVHIQAANAPPRIGAVGNLSMLESAAPTAVVITGIDSGQTGENQVLTFTAVASDPALFPSVTTTLVGSTGTITLTPAPFQSGSSVITVTVTDDASIATDPIARSTTVTFIATVVAVNNPPVVTITGATPTHIEDGPVTPVLTALTVTDVDNTTLTSATLTITNPLDGSNEILQAVTAGTSIVSSYDPNTGVLSLNASVPQPLSAFQQVLRTVGYRTASDNPTTGTPRIIRVVVSDGTSDSLPVTAAVNVQATNDPPVLSGTATDLPTILENDTASTGIPIDALIGNLVVISDPDNTQRGVAIADTAGAVAGTWQYSTDNAAHWNVFPALAGGVHLVLKSDGSGLNRIRFVPTGDDNGSVSVTWRAWDLSDGLTDGQTVTVTGAGAAPSPYSSSTLTANLTITPVNDAPQLLAPFTGTLTAVAEDSTSHLGDDVASILGSRISDVDAGALTGIAVVGADTTNGSWQYSIDDGANWSTFGTVADATATVLATNANQTRIRFIPALNFNGTATITYRGWDRSDGSASGLTGVDTSLNGGITAFSSLTATATVTVTPVNDAPVLSGLVASAVIDTIAEDVPDASNGGVSVISILSKLVTSDVDTGASAVGVAVVGIDAGNGNWFFDDGSSVWQNFNLALPNDSTARLLSASALHKIRFVPNPNFNGTATLTLRAWDATSGTNGGTGNASLNGGTTAFSTATVVMQVDVTPANDQPTIAGATQLPPIAEDIGIDPVANPGSSVANLIATLTVTDPDAGAVRGFAITAVDNTNGAWEYSLDGTTWLTVGAPTVASAVVVASDADNRIRFVPAANFNGSASCTVKAWDQSDSAVDGSAGHNATGASVTGAYSSGTATISVTVNPVNDAPVSTAPGLVGHPLLTILEDPLTNPGTTVAALIIGQVTDVDAGAAEGIAVVGTTGSGTWQFSVDSGTTWLPIDSVVGVPVSQTTARLLSDAGTTLVRFVPVLDANGTATISYRIWDRTSGSNGLGGVDVSTAHGGITAFSDEIVTSTITITPVNDAPTMTVVLAAGSGTGLEDHTIPVALDPLSTLGDVDAATLTLTVTAPGGTLNATNVRPLVTVTAVSADTLTATGSPVELAAWLAGFTATWDPPANAFGNQPLDFSVSDGSLTATGSATLTVTAVNDPPTIAGFVDLPAIHEDEASGTNDGMSIQALLAAGTVVVADIDSTTRGIAIESAPATPGGSWQYSITGIGGWIDVPTITVGKVLLLAADAGNLNRLRYRPASNEFGTPAATCVVRAWDQAFGVNAQIPLPTIAALGTSLSAAPGIAVRITITPVNDAPLLTGNGTLADINEDDVNNAGTAVIDLLGSTVSDVDGPALGIAVTGADTTKGVWQYTLNNGVAWIPFSGLSAGSATLLPGDPGRASRVRFVPAADQFGTATIDYLAWDGSTGISGQTGVNPLSTAFSSGPVAVAQATQSILPVNDAPVLSTAGPVVVETLAEDTSTNGVAVSSLLLPATLVTNDVDTGLPATGIAVVGVDNSFGTWQFSSDSGTTWSAVLVGGFAVNNGNALLLTSNAANRLRFVPAPQDSGTATLTLRAWDQTSNGVNTVPNGGVTAYSATTAVLSIVVTPVNDPPVVDLNGPTTAGINASATFTEGDGLHAVLPQAVVSDIDSPNLAGLSITLTASADAASESLGVDTTGTTITAAVGAGTVSLTGASSLSDYQQVLRSLTFTNSSSNPTAGTRTITVVADDGAGGLGAAVLTVTVVPVNNPPDLVTNPFTLSLGQTVSLSGFAPAVLSGSDVETTDPNLLTFVIDLAPGQGQLLKSGVPLGIGGTFTLAEFQTPNLITYKHTAAVGGSDGFAVRLTDPNGGSSALKTVIVTITGLAPPVITLGGGPLTVNEEMATPATIDIGITTGVTDADTPIFDGGTLTATLSGAGAGDILSVSGVTAGTVAIGGTTIGTATGGTAGNPLVITFTTNGTATQARVSTLLKSLQYQNISDTPPSVARTLTVVINDGGTNSAPATTTITITPFDDPPRITVPTLFITVPGISRQGQVVAVDPESAPLSYSVVTSPTQGSLVISPTTGVFTYTAVSNPSPNDSFTIQVSDGTKTSQQVYSVVISQLGQPQPIITSPAPMVVWGGATLLYTPVVSTVGLISPVLQFELQGTLPGAFFNTANGSINWPTPPAPGASGYYHAAILVIDQANGRAFYQPLLLLWLPGAPG